MEKTKVVIASVLKPIDDTRMLEKFGLSMAETNKYDINIIGIESKNNPSFNNIHFHPLKNFSRLSFARVLAKWRVFKIILKVKPKVLIVNTHELLIVSFLYKILFGTTFHYDIRENYLKNILNTGIFSSVTKWPIAVYVRWKEFIYSPFIKHFILAEKIYTKQLPFIGNKYTVIENKYAPRDGERTAYKHTDPKGIDLVFTGTLSEENGLFDAIEWAGKLHELDERVKLRIVGYCAQRSELLRLREAIKGLDYVELNGGDHLVPHTEIVEAIEKADFGFVLKKNNNGTNDEKMLTRIFEYTANRLPIILIDNPYWSSYCDQFNAALTLDSSTKPDTLLKEMNTKQFYDKGNVSESLWAGEEARFLSLFN